MKNTILEISRRASRGGRVPIKIALLKIHDVATETNSNGLHWEESYVTNALPSVQGIPICAEFLDETKSVPLAHGHTGSEFVDGVEEPLFEDSEVVGTIESASIETITQGGSTFKALVGNGVLYNQRYPKFVKWVRENFALGTVDTSVEIMGLAENDNKIVYAEETPTSEFRTPEEFAFSGTCILSVTPADADATVLEIANKKNKEEHGVMDEEMKTLIQTTIKESIDRNSELSAKIEQLNADIATKDATISEQNATIEQVQAALDQLKAEHDTYWAEREALEKELVQLKVEKRLGEMNAALAEYSEEEQAYAASEINAFKEDPIKGDLDAIKAKICVGIVEAQKAQKKVSEQNAAREKAEDIYSDMYMDELDGEGEVNIF